MRRALYRGYASIRTRPLLQYLEEIQRTQWLSPEELSALQLRKLRAILEHASRTTPYYQRLFRDARFEPGGLSALDDLRALPLLDRDILTDAWESLRPTSPDLPATERSTGGSTGRPVRFLVDQHEMTTRSAHIYRNLRWFGWELGDRIAYVWGSDIDTREHRGWVGRTRDRLAGVLWLDAFGMHERELDEQLDRIGRFDPAVVIGYPSSLHLLARRAIESSIPRRLRGIETSAETLMPEVRNDLQRAFGCHVLDRYGCREAGVIAHECPAGRMHVNAESVLMEVVSGEVVVTTLNNFAMPLVRYRVEDHAELSTERCPCGRGLPLVREVKGRLSDIIRAPSGRLIHGEFFTHLFYGARGVRRFQITQTEPLRLEIRLIADQRFDESACRAIERAIHEHADPHFAVVWIPVFEIPTAPSGKFRFTISSVTHRAPRR